jgi:LDH2 family malate/lactate/ureidoglycolate dehydrogenase
VVEIRSAQELTDLALAIFRAAGATEENAQRVASSLVGANLAGHDSHGVIRIPSYIQDIRNGRLDPAATPELERESGATATIDGRTTFGTPPSPGLSREPQASRRSCSTSPPRTRPRAS